MPYLQLDFDAKRAAALVARACDVRPGDVLWGLAELWEHVYRTRSDVVGEMVIDGCFGPDPRFRTALAGYGFIEEQPGGWRVKGARERIFGAKESGSRGGAKTAASGKSLRNLKQNRPKASEGSTEGSFGGSPKGAPKRDRSSPTTHHPPSVEATPSAGPPAAAAEQVPLLPESPPEPPPDDGRFVRLRDRLVAAYERVRRAKYIFDGPKDAQAVKRLMRMTPDDEVIESRWVAALSRMVRPAVGIADFAARVNDFTSGAAPPGRGRASEADKNWSQPQRTTNDGKDLDL